MTTWKRLSSRKDRRETNALARKMALDHALRHGPMTIQETRKALGMKSKSSLYEKCWRGLILQAIKEGKIVRRTNPLTEVPNGY